MTHAIREVIAEAVQRDDYLILDELRSYLVLDQNALMSLVLQTGNIMRDVRLINACRQPEITPERRQTLLSLSSLVGKYEVITNAFKTPIIPDIELLLELLDVDSIPYHQKRSLISIARQAFAQQQTDAARLLTAWLIVHAGVDDIDMCEIFESTINDDGGDEWVFRKMMQMGYLQSLLRKAKKGQALVCAELLGELNKLPDDIKVVVIKRALGRRCA